LQRWKLLSHNGILRRGVYPEPVEGLLRMTSAVVVLKPRLQAVLATPNSNPDKNASQTQPQ
jgi:hypothetical protein